MKFEKPNKGAKKTDKFSQDFPSLKDKTRFMDAMYKGVIQENCLDKKRVLDTIDKMEKIEWSIENEDIPLIRAVLLELKKELEK